MLDLIAITWFLAAWLLQGWAIEQAPFSSQSLTRRMALARRSWMENMGQRDVRIVDTQIMSGLQNGTAFFASTSLLAMGGVFSLFNASDRILAFMQDVPFFGAVPRWLWEIKLMGLMLLYAYAFFKFGWAYRLFNYTSILIGAVPPSKLHGTAAHEQAVHRAASMNIEAGKHFNRGLRAFFLSVGYLGWFAGPVPLMASSTFLLVILLRRQYFSAAQKIVPGEGP